MKPSVHSFINDLYEIDPSLREHEEDLIPLIQQLLSRDPARAPDLSFVEELNSRLTRRAHELSSPSATASPFSFMSKTLYALAGATAAVIVAVPTASFLSQRSSPSDVAAPALFSYNVTKAPSNAFGNLKTLQASGNSRPQSGGGGPVNGYAPTPAAAPAAPATLETTANPVAPQAEDAAIGAKLVAPPPYDGEIVQYQYVAPDTLPALPQGTVSVLKRERAAARPGLETFLNSFTLGQVDLSSFGGSTMDNVTFSQDTKYGYMFTVMLREGTASISQNWEKWPQPENACRDEACYQRYRVKITDLPSDAETLRLAADFVKAHGIDVSRYGEPEADAQWKRDYESAVDKSQAYVPDYVAVLYPLLIDGKPVYDQGGAKTGIRVSVSVRAKRVSDVWGIQNLSYTSSDYAAVSGSGDVLAYIDGFERYPIMPLDIQPAPGGRVAPSPKVKTIKVQLGEPTLGFATYYAYDKTPAEELIVPAFIFPVEGTSDPQNVIWRQTVVVPLAKDLLDQSGFPGMGGVMR